MTCRASQNTISDKLFHSDVLTEIDFMFSTQKIKTLNGSFVMENSPKMNEEKIELNVSAVF